MLSLSLPPLTSLSLSLCRCLPERCLSMCVCVCVRAGIEYFVALLPVAHCQLLPLFASSRLAFLLTRSACVEGHFSLFGTFELGSSKSRVFRVC